MPNNTNEPFWQREIAFNAVDDSPMVVVPRDQFAPYVSLESLDASSTGSVQHTMASYEDLLGITERPLKYQNAEINDLGATGELRLDPADGQDFTDDGWEVGDTFEVVTFAANLEAELQVYTVSSVAAAVLGFSEDPSGFTGNGEIVVAQTRQPVDEDALPWEDWFIGLVTNSVGATGLVAGCRAVRIHQTIATGAGMQLIVKGVIGSIERPLPFDPSVNNLIGGRDMRQIAAATVHSVGLPISKQAEAIGPQPIVSAVFTNEEQGFGLRPKGQVDDSATDWVGAGLAVGDKVFVQHTPLTTNKAVYTVDFRDGGGVIRFREPLAGLPGTESNRTKVYRVANVTL